MYIDFTFAHVITDIVKDPRNEVVGYRLENGQVISKGEALDLSKQGAIKGISEGVANQKDEFFKSIPNEELCNLSNLPTIQIGEYTGRENQL
jgi:hypothetical protein